MQADEQPQPLRPAQQRAHAGGPDDAAPPHAASASVHATAATPVHAVSAASSASPSPVVDMNRMVVFCADKAGMSTTDSLNSKELINKVIYEASVGSAHYKAAQARNEKVAERIDKMKKNLSAAKARCSGQSPLAQAAALRMQRKLVDLEQGRLLDRNWIHIDMDAFYAAVEVRDRPELATKPIAVGNLSMISTSNYVARKYGVRSAMPGFIAIKLCPQLMFLPHNWTKYQKVAEQTRAIFRDYDPHFESGSMDEAYLDVTDFVRREQRRRARGKGAWTAIKRRKREQTNAEASATAAAGAASEGHAAAAAAAAAAAHATADGDDDAEASDPEDDDSDPNAPLTPDEIDANSLLAAEVASEIRRRIFEVTQLTASAGIACNRMLAKISTDINKPNGQFHLPSRADEVVRFMNALSVRKIPGVGKVMERVLNELGMERCEQMHSTPEAAMLLHDVFSGDTAHWLLSVSLGIASAHHHAEEDMKRKSISTERTFPPLSSYADLESKLIYLATRLAEDLVKQKCAGGKNVTLKLKTTAFELCTRSVTLERYVSSREDLIKYGVQLLKEEIDRLSALQAKQFKQNAQTAAGAASPATAAVVAGSPLKPAAPSAAHSSPSAAALRPAPHPPNSRDGVLHLRLMGLRLSTLKGDTHEVHATGTQSILNFIKAAPAAAHAAAAAAPAAATQTAVSSSTSAAAATAASSSFAHPSFASSSFSAKTSTPSKPRDRPSHSTPSDADIASFFDAPPDPGKASPQPVVAAAVAATASAATTTAARSRHASAPTIARFFTGKNLSAAMSAAARPATSTAARPPVSSSAMTDLTGDDADVGADAGADAWVHEEEEEEGWVEEWISQPDRELLRLDDATTFADADTTTTGVAAAAPPAPASNLASASPSIPVSTPSPFASSIHHPPAPSAAAVAAAVADPAAAAPAAASSSSSLSCPVCGKDLGREVGNLELNMHIDRCLSGGGKGASAGGASAAAAAARGKTAGTKRKHASSAHASSSNSSKKGVQTLTDILARAKHSATAAATRRSTSASSPHDAIQLD